jgi:pimeloyl-ACP methyl ester carboxylesterase
VLRAVSDAILRAAYGPAVTARLRSGGDAIVGAPAAVSSLVGLRASARLRAFPGPALVVNGERDLVFRPGARRWIADRPRTVRAVICRAGHLSNLDQPAVFARLVRGFARRVERERDEASRAV